MSRPSLTLGRVLSKPAPIMQRDGSLAPSPLETMPPSYSSPFPTWQGSKPHSQNSMPPRPQPFVFSPLALLEIPSRLTRPPSVSSVTKRWTLAPEMSVDLEEILAMRHISPLSLKDFEQYLLFEEYGAENLYFILWLKDYTARYYADASYLHLSHTIARAKATFFSSDSQYELNLAAVRVSEFYSLIGGTNSPANRFPSSVRAEIVNAPPHPDTFAAIRADVEVMLRSSARRFVHARSRNAGKQRTLCVVFGGLLSIAIALAPLMMSRFADRGRWTQFGMIPPLWLGVTVFLCSVNGICLVLYLMGGSRQLYPFELARPAISAPISQRPQSPYEASLATVDTVHDIKFLQPSAPPPSHSPTSLARYPPGRYDTKRQVASSWNSGIEEGYVLPYIRPSTPLGDIFEFETAGFIPVQDDSDSLTIIDRTSAYGESTIGPSSTYFTPAVATASRPSSSASKLIFDFDSLPVKTLNSTSGPCALQAAHGRGFKGTLARAIAPITRVRSPVISRAQWEVVVRSMAVAGLVSLSVTGILVAVPM